MTTLAARLAQPDMQGLPDWQAAQILNEPDEDLPLRRVAVSTRDAQEVLLLTGEWPAVLLTADNTSAPVAVRAACITLRDTIRQSSTIRADVPPIYAATAAVLGGLVAAGVLTQATVNALLALADRPQSWAEANGVEATARSVGLARGAI